MEEISKPPHPRHTREPMAQPQALPGPLPFTRSPVAACHHLLTVNNDEFLQSLSSEAAACLAAVCVPTCAPHTHVLNQRWKEVGSDLKRVELKLCLCPKQSLTSKQLRKPHSPLPLILPTVTHQWLFSLPESLPPPGCCP
jgi:hypothetical protein